jgi:ABC-type spermidine/putrescine transport system permease subunit II
VVLTENTADRSVHSVEFGGLCFPWPLIIAHVTFSITLVLSTVAARLHQLPRFLDEASADLGASPIRTFRKITFPLIFPAMLSGSILAVTLSFDKVVVSLFLKGRENTLPLLIWGRLRLGLSPEIHAAATIITVVSLVGVVASTILLGKSFWSFDSPDARGLYGRVLFGFGLHCCGVELMVAEIADSQTGGL